MTGLRTYALTAIFLICATPFAAQAGVVNTAHFVSPGSFALGGELEVNLSQGAGVAGNLRYTHGLNELMNVTGLIGTGGGDRGFRLGGNITFDFFPDIEGQPGIGIAAQGVYYRILNRGQVELTGIPYVHKAFTTGKNEVEPFLAFPLGMTFSEGLYKATGTLVLGAMFKSNELFRYSLEFGVAINNAPTYISAGVTYYH